MSTCHKRLANGQPCPGVRRLAADVDAFVWREATNIIRDPSYLCSLFVQTDTTWAPATQIARYTQLIATKQEERDGITDEVARLAGNTKLDGLRASLHLRYAQVTEEKEGYQAKLS